MFWKRLGIAAGVIGLLLFAFAFVLLRTYEAPPVDPAWAVEGTAAPKPGSVTVRFTGTSTLVFSDGGTTLIIDGWFSRPGPLTLAFGEIEPDVPAIELGLERNDIDRAAMVLPVHSHFDHAMDAPEVARQTGALLLGSESTANIARGWGLPENQIRIVRDGDRMRFGEFEVIVHETRHFEFPDPATREAALGDPNIAAPLVPPVKMLDYKLGVPFAVEIRHPRGSLLVQGSAGFVPGAFENVDVDVLFLGVGGLGSQTEAYRTSYWTETVDRTRPSRVVPIHWDDLTSPIEGPFRGSVRIAGALAKGVEKTEAFLREKAASRSDLEFWTLPRYAPVELF